MRIQDIAFRIDNRLRYLFEPLIIIKHGVPLCCVSTVEDYRVDCVVWNVSSPAIVK